MVIDGIYIYTSLKEAVWADGIDIVSSHDIAFPTARLPPATTASPSSAAFRNGAPTIPRENITITNCRFSSASAAIKFTEGNSRLVQHVVISNCAIFDCNRGITLQIATGGTVRDVVFSNITMDLHRFDWFWAGDGNAFNIEIHRTSEWNGEPPKPGEPGPGLIKDVIFHDIIVHCQGTSEIAGHPERPLEGITFDNIKFFISSDPKAPYDTATSAMIFRRAKNLKLRNIEVYWDKPTYDKWQSALLVEDVDGLQLSGFSGECRMAGAKYSRRSVESGEECQRWIIPSRRRHQRLPENRGRRQPRHSSLWQRFSPGQSAVRTRPGREAR